jgi:hypothetical protein
MVYLSPSLCNCGYHAICSLSTSCCLHDVTVSTSIKVMESIRRNLVSFVCRNVVFNHERTGLTTGGSILPPTIDSIDHGHKLIRLCIRKTYAIRFNKEVESIAPCLSSLEQDNTIQKPLFYKVSKTQSSVKVLQPSACYILPIHFLSTLYIEGFIRRSEYCTGIDRDIIYTVLSSNYTTLSLWLLQLQQAANGPPLT